MSGQSAYLPEYTCGGMGCTMHLRYCPDCGGSGEATDLLPPHIRRHAGGV